MTLPACIPYGTWWSTPFAKWQGSLSHLHALRLAATTGREALDRHGVPGEAIELGVLGTTVPQEASFYGLPWLAGMMGLPGLAGPTVSQACATSARCLALAAGAVATGEARVVLVVAADRTSNGPHLYYPDPHGPGGTGAREDWVLDNFGRDPFAGAAMVGTAENVARRYGIGTAEQHDLVLLRHAQYVTALADDRAFQRRYMPLPLRVPRPRGKGEIVLEGDEGVTASTAEGLARLRPVLPDGTVTFGGQTHPADGNAGLLVTAPERAAELSRDRGLIVRLLGFGQARVEAAHMPMAPVPAARRALDAAGVGIGAVDAVTTHNPFAVNDIVLSRETGYPLERMNVRGCSLIWGHPQGPTGLRAVIELIETLAERGGGTGLFTGCAAGDTGMALVVRVEDARR
jgi:acetyl-CoA acetyltransferase family protein